MATTMTKTMSTVRDNDDLNDHLQIYNLEGITLIWHDSNLNVTRRQQLRIAKQHIRTINNVVEFYKDEQECINRIKSITNEKILFVVSGSGAHSILSFDDKLVHKSVQSVFIFCRMKEKYESLPRCYQKIIGIFDDPEKLKVAIQQQVNLIQAHLETFNFYNEKNEQKSICNLSKQSATFLWLLIFKYIVVRLPKNEKAKREMIETCANYYRGNKSETNLIKKFDKTYKPEDAVYWYTRPSFIYKLVNKALRTEDIEQLYIFRFYISDLCDQIAKIQEQQNSHQQPLVLYRGVSLSLEEVNKWKENEGNLISTNGFLSTSFSEKVAMKFALTRTVTDTEESVLIEIECNRSSVPFAIIEHESVFSGEKEVLFDLGATFKVLSVTKPTDENAKIWIVKVRSTDEGNGLAKIYIEGCQKMLQRGAPIERLWGTMLVSMGQLDKSIKYFQKLADASLSSVPVDLLLRAIGGSLSRHEQYDEVLEYLKLKHKKMEKKNIVMPAIYFTKGTIYEQKAHYDQALVELWKCVQLDTELSEEVCILKASSYASIGAIYCSKGQYQLALDNFNKSKKTGEKYYRTDHVFFAKIFSGYGDVYREKKELHRALEFYQKAADITEKYYPNGYARIYYEMGGVFNSLGDYDESLKYYHRAGEIMQKSCDNTLTKSGDNFEVSGRIYRIKGELEKALESFEKILEIKLQILGPNHDSVAFSYYNKGTTLEQLNRNDEALITYQAALTIQKAVFPDGHRNIARTLYSIGNQHRLKGELALAKQYCNEALEMQIKLLPPNHIDISFTLSHIGTILFDQDDYDESWKYLWKALKLQRAFSNGVLHHYQTSTLITIGDVSIKRNCLDLALKCLKEALSIREKNFSQPHSQVSELQKKIEEVEQLKIS